GDWFSAGLIDKLCREGRQGLEKLSAKSVDAALDYAQSMSAWNCAFEGARGGMYGMTPARLSAIAANIQAHSSDAKALIKKRQSGAQGTFCSTCSRTTPSSMREVTERQRVQPRHHPRTRRKASALRPESVRHRVR